VLYRIFHGSIPSTGVTRKVPRSLTADRRAALSSVKAIG
jgi:hypothetical protein